MIKSYVQINLATDMMTSNLYDTVLLKPAIDGGDELFMVSGYASATFARRHIKDLIEQKGPGFKLNLIVGMPGKRTDHLAYLQLHTEFKAQFKGYYLIGSPPVHSKVFSWFTSGEPTEGYSGSANYSQYGFFEEKQVNQMVSDNPVAIKQFFDLLVTRSTSMLDIEITDLSSIRPSIHGSLPAGTIEWIETDKSVRISFLDKQGRLPGVSGLNWGQRKERRINHNTGEVALVDREPNQAYLSLRGESRKEGFLPPRAYNFTLITDDGQSFDCVRAQGDTGAEKAIQSTKDNSELGKYFRKRLGLGEGVLVTAEDLERYGRTDYTISKIDDENFLLDFSLPSN